MFGISRFFLSFTVKTVKTQLDEVIFTLETAADEAAPLLGYSIWKSAALTEPLVRNRFCSCRLCDPAGHILLA